MRIAILTTVHPALDGRIFHKEAVSLARAGHEVTLFAPLHPQAAAVAQNQGITYIPLVAKTRRLIRPYRWVQLMRLLQKQRFDVWHFHDPELLPLAVIWRRLFARSTSLLYDMHEDVPLDILDKPWIAKPLRRPVSSAFDIVERWGMRQCQVIITATDPIARRATVSGRPVFTVRNYPLPQSQKPATRLLAPGQPVRVIYCGGLTEIRGIRQVVLAMEELQDCPVELVLLGEFYPQAFEQEIRRRAGKNVSIHNQVPFQQVWSYLQASDIGIVCFQPTPNHREAMPNKLFEYMQAGLAVVASNFPLWRQIVEASGCGLVVDPLAPQQIAAAIRQLVADPAMRQKMGQAGDIAAHEKYAWDNECKTLLSAYQVLSKAST